MLNIEKLFNNLFSKVKNENLPKLLNSETKQNTIIVEEDLSLINYVHSIIEDIDLTFPPGIAGKICQELELYEYRPLPELRPLVALSSLSMVNQQRKGYGSGNLNFQSIAPLKLQPMYVRHKETPPPLAPSSAT